MARQINYQYYHWGPYLYKTFLEKEEIEKIKKLCSKKLKSYRSKLAGLIKHEYQIDSKKLVSILLPYVNSYMQGAANYGGDIPPGNEIKLTSAWVNYMTKFESNPLHFHEEDLSFVIFTHIPEELKQEKKENDDISPFASGPGAITFIDSLRENNFTISKNTFFPEVGDFFIFPASLHHLVNPFKSEGERISVSGNLKIING
jgi:hypothetical protein